MNSTGVLKSPNLAKRLAAGLPVTLKIAGGH